MVRNTSSATDTSITTSIFSSFYKLISKHFIQNRHKHHSINQKKKKGGINTIFQLTNKIFKTTNTLITKDNGTSAIDTVKPWN